MGNGALPNGPSYRAHPRLYQLGHEGQHFAAVRSPVRSERCYTSPTEVSSVCSRPIKVATMSEVRPQLLITLVHGTWPHGFVRTFFWTPRRRHRSPLWFEDGSPFLSRLSAELHDISHKITPLLWSGENSIFERDKAAHVLAEYLLDEHAQHPQATQLVIAHSHGGNVALCALNHLQKREAAQLREEEPANPFIVTLATPFVEVHRADFGQRPIHVRLAIIMAISYLLTLVYDFILGRSYDLLNIKFWLVSLLTSGCAVLTWWWGFFRWSNRGTARQEQVNALKDATQLGELVSISAKRLLVIRAIDDEASLALAFGTIFSYVTARFITYVYILLTVLTAPLLIFIPVTPAVGLAAIIAFPSLRPFWTWLSETDLSISLWKPAIFTGYIVSIAVLVGVFMIARTVHGRELARSPMECQINTNSTPDAKGLSEIITLVRRTYVRSFRHGIYDHEDCAKTIANWVR
jgi:hypothetical protein